MAEWYASLHLISMQRSSNLSYRAVTSTISIYVLSCCYKNGPLCGGVAKYYIICELVKIAHVIFRRNFRIKMAGILYMRRGTAYFEAIARPRRRKSR